MSKRRYPNLEVIFDVDKKIKRIEALEGELARPDFWKDEAHSKEVILKLKDLKSATEPFKKLEDDFKSIKELVAIAGPEDIDELKHFYLEVEGMKKKLADLEFRSLLGVDHDKSNAILSINAGAGGTESCDWAGMLLRMYTRWAEGKNYKITRLDQLLGEEAGIKNVTVLVSGSYAYGYLKSEIGVHRLVRISPFDANKRRHTSFASVDVIPEISDEIKVDIKESDLRIDTFRAGGKGGQHVNKTDSAVRITHRPTGIVVQCQNERSQFKNKSMALKILSSKLYEIESKRKKKEMENAYQSKKDIAWGSQIRSYVLHPYSLVKDHRTEFETGNAQGVLDGELDGFIEAYLKKIQKSKFKNQK